MITCRFKEIKIGTIYRAYVQNVPFAFIKTEGGIDIGMRPIGNCVCLTGEYAGTRMLCGEDEAVDIKEPA